MSLVRRFCNKCRTITWHDVARRKHACTECGTAYARTDTRIKAKRLGES